VSGVRVLRVWVRTTWCGNHCGEVRWRTFRRRVRPSAGPVLTSNFMLTTMPGDTTAIKELADGARGAIERIADFFHVFDLTFLVSGSLTFAAFAFIYRHSGAATAWPFAEWVGVAAVLIGCYASGLMSFAVGRGMNARARKKRLTALLPDAILFQQPNAPIASAEQSERIYVRMWQALVAAGPRSLMMQHLMRYWAMAAIYDGLAAGFALWAVVVVVSAFPPLVAYPVSLRLALMVAFPASLLSLVARFQAQKYYDYEIEDVVAANAVWRDGSEERMSK
jgi:hypothetical protein